MATCRGSSRIHTCGCPRVRRHVRPLCAMEPVTTGAYSHAPATMTRLQARIEWIERDSASIQDHEARIRALEATKNKLLGGCILLGSIASGTLGCLALVITQHLPLQGVDCP